MLKVVGLYVLAWVGILAALVAYISFAPRNGGFTQASVNMTARVLGIAFGIGLAYILVRRGSLGPKEKEDKPWSIDDELLK